MLAPGRRLDELPVAATPTALCSEATESIIKRNISFLEVKSQSNILLLFDLSESSKEGCLLKITSHLIIQLLFLPHLVPFEWL
jgi:hypothetical protein